MSGSSSYIRILSIDPCPKGFGFVVVESRPRLVDWGLARVWATKSEEYLARVEGLIDRYRLEIIVLEESSSARRSQRIRERILLLARHFEGSGIQLLRVERRAAQIALAGEHATKRAVALQIAGLFPELLPHVPPPRKPWMTEDDRMSIFDAAVLGLASLIGK